MTKTIKRLLPAALAVLLAGCAMQPVDSTTACYRAVSYTHLTLPTILLV